MWTNLPAQKREEYKQMILALASLSELFAQKSESPDEIPGPFINSKYQETVFQKTFNATAEDIGNTSYDASINLSSEYAKKYLVGIKTFGIGSGMQKIAQFKANHDEWIELIDKIRANSINQNGDFKSKEEINSVNLPLYLELAKRIAILRNKRIDSSEANLQGFSYNKNKNQIEAVYHVLMPSKKGVIPPTISVGEISYERIDSDHITILGCTTRDNPTNFDFEDGIHKYRFTSADSQLLMDFNNKDIVKEKWDVKYAEDPYGIFALISHGIYGNQSFDIQDYGLQFAEKKTSYGAPGKVKTESYSWELKVHPFSGFNSFYGVCPKTKCPEKIEKLKITYENTVPKDALNIAINTASLFHNEVPPKTQDDKQERARLRSETMSVVYKTGNQAFISDVSKLLYRNVNELYIPIPNSKNFHTSHPDFFGNGYGTFDNTGSRLKRSKDQLRFNLVFEPSGEKILSYITQSNGKAIESATKQSYLGEWILRGVFQLKPYEQLTQEKLQEIGINAIRLSKRNGNSDIHLSFIWIDPENPPEDFIQ